MLGFNVGEGLRIKLNLVTFLVLSLGLSYLMATQVVSVLQPRYPVYAIFNDAGGVFTGQEVTYRGVAVGQVGTMSLVPEGVKIEMKIEEDVKIPSDGVVARVMFKSAVGEQFIDLLPESSGGPYLARGDVIPNDRTEIPVQTQELLTTLESVLQGVPPDDLKGAVEALGNGLTGRGPDIATLIESIADISETFALRASNVEDILVQGTRVGGAFLDSRRDFADAIRRLVLVSETLAGNTNNLEHLMRGGNLASDEIVSWIRENRAQLNEFLIKFGKFNAFQAEHQDDLAGMFRNLPAAVEKVNKTFEPKTGMIRFGLVNDKSNPGCSYVERERRPPSARAPKLPPKHVDCGDDAGSASTSKNSADPPTANRSTSAAKASVIGNLDPGTGVPALPNRMRDWSWLLFYLRPLSL